MAKRKKKIKVDTNKSSYDIYKTIRKTWGELNPTTKVEEDKTKYNRKKEKNKVKKDLESEVS